MVRVGVLLVTPLADELKPSGRVARVIGRIRISVRVILVEVSAEHRVPECALITEVFQRSNNEVQARDCVIMSPNLGVSIVA